MKRSLVFLLFFVLCNFVSLAQPGDPGGGKNPFTTPISGIEWLLLAGGILGVRRIYQKLKDR